MISSIHGNLYSYSTICPLQFHLIIAGIDSHRAEGLLVGKDAQQCDPGDRALTHPKHSETYGIHWGGFWLLESSKKAHMEPECPETLRKS